MMPIILIKAMTMIMTMIMKLIISTEGALRRPMTNNRQKDRKTEKQKHRKTAKTERQKDRKTE